MNITKYVLGFAFGNDGAEDGVVLIKKIKPDWQAGKLNAPGGKIEPTDKSPKHAMKREFLEETNIETSLADWRHFATMKGAEFKVYCYSMLLDEEDVNQGMASVTPEEVGFYYLNNIQHEDKLLNNIKWLIEMSKDSDTFRKPLEIVYK